MIAAARFSEPRFERSIAFAARATVTDHAGGSDITHCHVELLDQVGAQLAFVALRDKELRQLLKDAVTVLPMAGAARFVVAHETSHQLGCAGADTWRVYSTALGDVVLDLLDEEAAKGDVLDVVADGPGNIVRIVLDPKAFAEFFASACRVYGATAAEIMDARQW